jgi:pyrroloquinoline-quinone synthase
MKEQIWDDETFISRLRETGARAYHDKHPFHLRMNAGQLSREALQGWVANRFCYQRNIPRKDASIMANCPLPEVRRTWLHRIVDHDGAETGDGGIEAWLRLGKACGLKREDMLDGRDVAFGVQVAVDAYRSFAQSEPWPVAVASSLTELFAPDLMAARLSSFEQHYAWIEPAGLDYFKRRLSQAPRDSREALTITLAHCRTPELQNAAVQALIFKCDVLWSILDAIALKYVPECLTHGDS